MRNPLPIIVLAQFGCTSLWFAGNAILPDLAHQLQLPAGFLAHLTSAVQLGFIAGTLVFALLAIADRFSPSRVFFVCAGLAGLLNLGVSADGLSATGLLALRFGTGFLLAGIYPVGMKIASDYYQRGLGVSLGFLVGALVLGTAFPHLLRGLTTALPYRSVIYGTSLLAGLGGLAMLLLVPDGPYRQARAVVPGSPLGRSSFFLGFRDSGFRSAALGYFGHMWELYAFWAFVPVMLAQFTRQHPLASLNVSLLSFLIIAGGSLGCVAGGYLSLRIGAKRVALVALSLSGLCCLVSPVVLGGSSPALLVGFLIFWGIVVVADSPLFSTLVAQNAPAASRGTALTLVNCIGFSLTIVSIQLLNGLLVSVDASYLYMILAVGPAIGVAVLLKNR